MFQSVYLPFILLTPQATELPSTQSPTKTHAAADECKPPGFEESILKRTRDLPTGVNVVVRGYDFNQGVDYTALFNSFSSTGFQATHFGQAIDVVNKMWNQRSQIPDTDEARVNLESATNLHPFKRKATACTIFLAYTSNMVSCGVRDVIRFLAENNMIDVLVTSAGGVEEDIIKCMSPFYVGSFDRWSGQHLRELGVNRIGNLLVPNDNYVQFEKWMMPVLDQMLEEQNTQGTNWTPSKMIDRLGEKINNPESIYYWCHVNKIPVFCPALTDGSIGDVLFSHTYRSPGLRLDLIEDISCINRISIYSLHTGMIVLGGGVAKHHTFNANLMRNGADFTVLINTGQEFDGCDSGARPDEAVSWGKIRGQAEPVKIFADASLIFPLLVSCTFAKYQNSCVPASRLNGDMG